MTSELATGRLASENPTAPPCTKLPDLGEFLALAFFRHRSQRIDAAISGSFGLQPDKLRRRSIIHNRMRVGLRRDGRETAGQRRGSSGRRAFVFFEAWFSQ